jgi:hypothetical protein
VALPEHPSRDLGLQPPAGARPDRHPERAPLCRNESLHVFALP